MAEDVGERLRLEMTEAETRAWDSLARYKFQMFGYWAAIWVHLNRVADTRRPNPWKSLVLGARKRDGLAIWTATTEGDNCPLTTTAHFSEGAAWTRIKHDLHQMGVPGALVIKDGEGVVTAWNRAADGAAIVEEHYVHG